MSTEVLGIRHVHQRYGERVALHDVSFAAEEGALVALLGPNGSGKTTLFRIISTLLPPDRGEVEVCGHDVVRDPTAVRLRLGVVFQQAALDSELTVRENLRFHAALYGLSSSRATSALDDALRALRLEDRANDRVKTLSGGLVRRADLARVLMHRPRLLLLDEPTVGLDPAARHDFWASLDDLRRTRSTTILVATHLLEEADRCDHLVILSTGRVVAEGSPEDLKSTLGGETLWIESDNPTDLADRIQAQFGLNARVVDGAVHVAHAQAHQLLARIYEAFPSRIQSATVRKPTLDDVFMVHAGHGLTRTEDVEDAGQARVITS